jgi:type I restriction enzyme S subunit
MNVHSSGFKSDGLAFIDADEAKNLDHVIVQPNDVLLNITGASIGRVTTAPNALAGARVNQHVCIIRTKEELSSSFLSYFLASPKEQARVMNIQVGATRQALTKAMILDWDIPVPPFHEQQEIVTEIDKQSSRLDDAVANLKRVKANLKRYKAAVLKAAVEGKLTEDWRKQHPNVEPASKLVEHILAERRAKWSGKGKYKEPVAPDTISLPHLPKGWMWATCDQLCSQITDGEHIQPRYKPVGYPMLSAKNVRDGYVDFGDIDLISEVDFQNCLKRCSPKENDVLIVSVGATTGRTAIVGRCEPFSLVRSVLLLRPLQNPRFMLRWLQSPWTQTLIQRASGSTAQAHLYIRDTRTISIPLPPDHEQKEIIAEVERRLSVIEELEAAVEANLTRADRLRQSVLRSAFSGRLVDSNITTANPIRQILSTDSATMSPF